MRKSALALLACAPLVAFAGQPASAAITEHGVSFSQLGARCAPSINIHTLSSLVRQESRVNPYAINVNGGRRLSHQPANAAEAVATAQRLLDAGYNIDVGLGQINSGNFGWLGLSLSQLFEPCANLSASARVLSACYQRAVAVQGEGQAALRAALSCYNTGSLSKGFKNGYVRAVVAQAALPVPELLPMTPGDRRAAPVPLHAGRGAEPQKASTKGAGETAQQGGGGTVPPGGDVFATNADADAFAVAASEEGGNENKHN